MYKQVFNPLSGKFDLVSIFDNSTNNARITYLENNTYKVTYYAAVSAATGTITIPTGATIKLDEFQGGVDAFVSTIVAGKVTGRNPVTSGGTIVDVASFDALGNYTLTGTPSAYPVAIVYVLTIHASAWQNLTTDNIVEAAIVINGAAAPITFNSNTGTISTSMSTNKLIGRSTAGTGVMEEITLGSNLSYTGATLNVGTGTLGSAAYTSSSAYEVPLTFSTGSTRNTNTITINLSTGVSGGQTVIGGTASGNSLTLSSTTNGTKGLINFGTAATSYFNETNNTLTLSSLTVTRVIYATTAGLLTDSANLTFDGSALKAGAVNGVYIGTNSGVNSSIWAGKATPSNTNFSFQGDSTSSYFNSVTGGTIGFYYDNATNVANFNKTNIQLLNTYIGSISTTPTAVLHLKAGTATASTPPLKFTAGIPNTTPESGAMETDSNNNLWYTNSTAVRGKVNIIRPFVSSAGTLVLAVTYTNYVFTGTTTTWTLPALTGNTNIFFYIKNRGSGIITLNSSAGGNDMYTTSAVSTISINPGEAYFLVNDGTYFNIE